MSIAPNNVAIVFNAKPEIGATKLRDAGGNLRYLSVGVLLGVFGVRDQRLNGSVLDLKSLH
jgi:hypothetical protein